MNNKVQNIPKPSSSGAAPEPVPSVPTSPALKEFERRNPHLKAFLERNPTGKMEVIKS